MRKLKIFFLAVIVIGFVALSGGCKKTTENITQGTDSVYSSGWFEPSLTLDPNDSLYEGTISNSAITQAVVADGVVLSYIGTVGTLPGSTASDTLGEVATDFGVYTTFQVGSLFISSVPSDDDGIGDIVSDGYFFRYVIVPGSVLATNNLTKQQAKSMSFTAITKLLSAAKASSPASIIQ